MDPIVAISTVADGSMYNRNNPLDSDVIKNRQTFFKKFGITLDQATPLKVAYNTENFCRYTDVTTPITFHAMHANFVPPYDGIVTTKTGHALYLPLADCVGATFYDPIHHVLGLAHLGRHSLEQQGGRKFVEYLHLHFHCDPNTLKVWLGPAPGKDVYPIWKLEHKGMKEVTFEQLYAAGILQENIFDNPAETDKDQRYYSYSEFLKGNRAVDGDHVMITMMR
ncbi:MAG: laccase domain-containing protein [Candidatus Microsaccharimonas sossegonensis]|uniref:Laccase domain-containing protein n=1 Tax=Candidatus Microsaccharimonas sossegonensis TaxID=2506948 RepID=A0A4V1J7J1_9BACT|nr:MAG: laccase domain-containing protein [Candidatus Microsaccharimonas sossegonensis]